MISRFLKRTSVPNPMKTTPEMKSIHLSDILEAMNFPQMTAMIVMIANP